MKQWTMPKRSRASALRRIPWSVPVVERSKELLELDKLTETQKAEILALRLREKQAEMGMK